MSRPRKPYGPHPPGRLLATMIKVLAAELSDQARLARGKRYWADDAVVDIVVGHGAVTAEIQGSRAEPYVVTLETSGGEGIPTKRELWVQCTCPDDTASGLAACKHAVAALFALSDEVAIEPELVDRWRAGRRQGRDPAEATVTELPVGGGAPDGDRHDARPDRRGRRHEAGDDAGDDGPARGAEVIELRPHRRDPGCESLSMLLRAPVGASPPAFPDPLPIEHAGLRDRLLAEVLADALDHLAIRWE